jgi:hypothetical protein
MQREVGPQVAPPLFIHHQIQPMPPHAAAAVKKRGQPCPAAAAAPAEAAAGNWNPRLWDWDSRALTARPSADALRLAGGQPQPQPQQAAEVHRQGAGGSGALKLQLGPREGSTAPTDASPTAPAASLSPSPPASGQDLVVRPSKRVRSGSPGSAGGGGGGAANGGAGYPMCQVDECRADLTGAKDYHRRHKVCETHSKTIRAVVANQAQRFCQQCSR